MEKVFLRVSNLWVAPCTMLCVLLWIAACDDDAGGNSDTSSEANGAAGIGGGTGAALQNGTNGGVAGATAGGDDTDSGNGATNTVGNGGSNGDSGSNGGSNGSSNGAGGTYAGDYGAPGPFADAQMIPNVGPGNNYTLFRPMDSLGRDGFQHPIAAWGNGISTTPDQYESTLVHLASHGFVIAACNDTQAERPCLNTGLEWLIEQNASGDMQGMLDTSTEVTLGYSWGGGAAIDTADRPNVVATASLYGMPPRGDNAFAQMHAPLILFTSTGDTFVDADGYVTPNFNNSQVQTFYATRHAPEGHLYIIDEGAISCVASIFLTGPCGNAMAERAPLTAWLRLWAYGEQDARRYFYGDDCELCQSPWSAQRKHWD